MAVATPELSQAEEGSPVASPAPALFDFDIYLVLIVAALVAIGLLMVYSTTFYWSYLEYDTPVRIFLKQVRSLAVGLVALVIAWRMDYRLLRDRRVALAIMIVTIAALGGLLLVGGNTTLGAQRAFYQGSLQPGEAAKLAVILYFGAWLASRQGQLRRIGYGLIPFSVLVGLVVGLIVLQPDLSTAAIILATAWTMFFVAGANIVQILLAGGGAAFVGWMVTTQFEYARTRLAEHLLAMSDLTQASWHVQQAIIAFTAPAATRPGGSFSPNWFGVGLGQSRQKFGFLPAAHTDSIFAIIGEEMGLFGCLVVITLFVLFVWRAFRISSEAQEPFGALLAAGVGAWVAFEALLNVGVMTAVIPFTGVPLPFISYGGSHLVTVMGAVGLLMSISRRRPFSQRLANIDARRRGGEERPTARRTRPRTRRMDRVGRRGRIEY
jgi:cell division protein FtsW